MTQSIDVRSPRPTPNRNHKEGYVTSVLIFVFYLILVYLQKFEIPYTVVVLTIQAPKPG